MSMDQSVRGSYTIEAALICPFLCLVLCLLLSGTLALYEKVHRYGEECVQLLEQMEPASDRIRMERVVGDFWEDITNDAS